MDINGFKKPTLSYEYHACTQTLTTFLLPRDGWVAKQQRGVLEKSSLDTNS